MSIWTEIERDQLRSDNAALRARVAELEEQNSALRSRISTAENHTARAVAQAKQYREALIQIDKHWRMVGGALAEHSAICKIARKALEGGE